MNDLKPKVSIIGAGNVGVRFAYALMIKGIAREVVIVDLNRKRGEGEAMDLSHGGPYILSPVEVIAGDYHDVINSDLVVITAGAKQSSRQSRLELVNTNLEIFKLIIPQLMRYTPDAIFLVVTNPVDVMSYITYRLSNKSWQTVIGSGTVLDTARFRYLIGKHCDIDSRSVHAYILGEHGDSEFPVWSSAMIGGVFLKDYCPTCKNFKNCKHQEELNRIFLEVRDSAYRIIERKGETSYGIGLALVRISFAILNNENSVLPVSHLIDGYLGVKDIYLSTPVIINRSGIREVLKLKLSEEERVAFKNSANVIATILKNLKI